MHPTASAPPPLADGWHAPSRHARFAALLAIGSRAALLAVLAAVVLIAVAPPAADGAEPPEITAAATAHQQPDPDPDPEPPLPDPDDIPFSPAPHPGDLLLPPTPDDPATDTEAAPTGTYTDPDNSGPTDTTGGTEPTSPSEGQSPSEGDGATAPPGEESGDESCTGPGCLPPAGESQPLPPNSDAPGTAPAPGTGATSTCGIWDLSGCISQAINGFLRAAVTDALNPGLELLSGTLLATPTLDQLPRVAELWQSSWQLLLACYAILIVIAGILVMGYETVQTRYSIRELLPRLVLGFVAGALSLWAAGLAIQIANALSRAVLSAGVNPDAGAAALADIVASALVDDGGIFLLLLGVVLAVLLLGLLLVYVVRVALTILLVVAAPLALMLHALPHTEGIARWWWRAFAGCLAIQIAQSLTLVTALRVFLADDGFATTLFGTAPTNSGWINILVSLALLYILWKIPFWILGSIRGHHGRSLVGGLVRGFLLYKTAGLLGRGGRSLAGLMRNGRPSGGPGRGGGPAGPDPYQRVTATSNGQLLLPLPGLRRQPPRPKPTPAQPSSRSPSRAGRSAGAGRQLALPLEEGLWPEQRAVLGPDGQYRFAFRPDRVPRPNTAPHPPPPSWRGPAPGGRQLALPLGEGVWPEQRAVLGPDGQYRFAFPVPRGPHPGP
ncbi:hypothetical protein, partial [Pseudonocardia nigra]|uniref:hypothetical protein n=1 Tax=Pseudonocardia nigra TaxID=1921578 RepID=UPI001C5D39F2